MADLRKKDFGLTGMLDIYVKIVEDGNCDIARFQAKPVSISERGRIFSMEASLIPDYFCGVEFDSIVTSCKILINDTLLWECNKPIRGFNFENPQLQCRNNKFRVEFAYENDLVKLFPKICYEMYAEINNSPDREDRDLEIEGKIFTIEP